MKVLFYVEPLIERSSPCWKEAWLTFSQIIMNALQPDKANWNDHFRIVTNRPLRDLAILRYGIQEEIVGVMEQRDLLSCFNGDYLLASIKWYDESYSKDQAVSVGLAVRRVTGYFEPDAIIVFAPAPYLRYSFPEAVVLHMEYGMFSRPPFPRTFYLDPFGMFRHSALRRFQQQLRQLTIGEMEKSLLDSLRNRYLTEILAAQSPFNEHRAQIFRRFASVWLLPLQFSGYYSFDSMTSYREQFDYACWILDSSPPDAGILVTQHPEHPMLNYERTQYLQKTFPNFIYVPMETEVYGASQFLLDLVDGVISISSSVAMQALLWKKKVVAVGDSHLVAIADARDVSDLNGVKNDPWDEQRDAMLWWLLTRYYIPEHYLRFESFLRTLIREAVDRHRSGRMGLDFFKPIDDERQLINFLISQADASVPHVNSSLASRLSLSSVESLVDRIGVLTEEGNKCRSDLAQCRSDLAQCRSDLAQCRNSLGWKVWSILVKVKKLVRKFLHTPGG